RPRGAGHDEVRARQDTALQPPLHALLQRRRVARAVGGDPGVAEIGCPGKPVAALEEETKEMDTVRRAGGYDRVRTEVPDRAGGSPERWPQPGRVARQAPQRPG